MNTLNLIRQKVAKRSKLSQAQFLMSKTYRGTDYTSAHLSPASAAREAYRGVGYISDPRAFGPFYCLILFRKHQCAR